MDTFATWADVSKIGINGGSFGGYITCMALTYGADVFTHGIANYSVTDWNLYDSHYTERFMKTPKENEEGYRITSALTYANKYKGVLRIVHGSTDDNVHMQNSIQLINKLEDLNKSFEMMIYPNQRHGIGQPKRFIILPKQLNLLIGICWRRNNKRRWERPISSSNIELI